jgi:hypothetical protein
MLGVAGPVATRDESAVAKLSGDFGAWQFAGVGPGMTTEGFVRRIEGDFACRVDSCSASCRSRRGSIYLGADFDRQGVVARVMIHIGSFPFRHDGLCRALLKEAAGLENRYGAPTKIQAGRCRSELAGRDLVAWASEDRVLALRTQLLEETSELWMILAARPDAINPR